MKQILLSLAFVGISVMTMAQTARQITPANAGSFDVIKHTSKGEEHINVNYVLQSAPFINVLTLNLNTPDPMSMSVKITDGSGATVINWIPEQVNYTYQHAFDISNLKAGKYKLDVYGEGNNKLHTLNFEKQNAVTTQNNSRN